LLRVLKRPALPANRWGNNGKNSRSQPGWLVCFGAMDVASTF
jgi:hypothetical protein